MNDTSKKQRPVKEPENKLWSMNDASIRNIEKLSNRNPDEGLRSHETEALGTDKFQQDKNELN